LIVIAGLRIQLMEHQKLNRSQFHLLTSKDCYFHRSQIFNYSFPGADRRARIPASNDFAYPRDVFQVSLRALPDQRFTAFSAVLSRISVNLEGAPFVENFSPLSSLSMSR
jgi:hypothetical protein